ncbi:MAG: hypothetical protein WA814_07370 [Candidatus Baltobacteraceae bacterium]
MISGRVYRRRRALLWSTIASALFHVIFLTVLFYAAARLFVTRGTREVVSQSTVVTMERRVVATPAPARTARPVRQRESAPAITPRYELAKVAPHASPQPPRPPRPPIVSNVTRDQAGFAKEVAQLNKENDPHAIPTIAPGSRGSSSKSYAFAPPSSGDEHGNGVITPTQSWHDGGRDCYYGRYEYTYPDGAEENGSIAWPFCYDPDSDPFHEPPHLMPFPLPLPGYKLPAGTQLPPIEKSVYTQWAGNAPGYGSAP